MTPGSIAFFLGALAITGLITKGILVALKSWSAELPKMFAANGLSLVLSTVLAGIGFADGGTPKFEEAFSLYVVPQVVVLGLTLYGRSKKQKELQSSARQTPDAQGAATAQEIKPTLLKRGLILVAGIGAFVVAFPIAGELGREARGLVSRATMTTQERDRLINEGLLTAMVAEKKNLPRTLDASTTLTDLRVSGTNIVYVHAIQGYRSLSVDALERTVRQKVCANSNLKEVITEGASLTYEYWSSPQREYLGRFQIASCS